MRSLVLTATVFNSCTSLFFFCSRKIRSTPEAVVGPLLKLRNATGINTVGSDDACSTNGGIARSAGTSCSHFPVRFNYRTTLTGLADEHATENLQALVGRRTPPHS
ncbi:hypothetical protein PF003_g25125 [Phytophthora fragariae]|nr:hypothetical protein PF003_g25125 [Phytophthora fragariae]